MSEKYTAVCFITIRCKAVVEPQDGGVGMRLLEDPVRISDTTIFASKGQETPSELIIKTVREILPIAIVQKAAENAPLPTNVENRQDAVAVKKEDLN